MDKRQAYIDEKSTEIMAAPKEDRAALAMIWMASEIVRLRGDVISLTTEVKAIRSIAEAHPIKR